MKVKDLIEKLSTLPPDATVIAYDGELERNAEVTGLLYSPNGRYIACAPDHESIVTVEGETVEICTDE